ncbi:MAG: HD domain-containing protein [Candidatus Aenigmarchaeota archaeon]|nr:HD domain-containing protein [Candidatus Aenigmarchaeota archaeon]
MDKLKSIENQVRNLYNNSDNEFMKTWFFQNHVKVVSNYSEQISSVNNSNKEVCVLASLFHDIARAWGVWSDPQLMDESLKKAEELMSKENYTQDMISKVKDAIFYHSCEDKLPKTTEGKVVATADALAHLMTDFYLVILYNKWIEKAKNLETYRKWVLEKVDRDFNKKVFFEEWKAKSKQRYEAIKTFFQPI